MTKSQPLDKQPQQHLLDAYGGTEAGTSQFGSELCKLCRFRVGQASGQSKTVAQNKAFADACN